MLQVYSCCLLQPLYLDQFFWLLLDSPTNITSFVTSTPSISSQALVSSVGRGCGDEALGTRVGGSGAGGATRCPHSLTRPHTAIPSEANQAGLGLVTRAGHNSPSPHAAASLAFPIWEVKSARKYQDQENWVQVWLQYVRLLPVVYKCNSQDNVWRPQTRLLRTLTV